MRKVKLIRVKREYNDWETICSLKFEGDWEELTDKEFGELHDIVYRYNASTADKTGGLSIVEEIALKSKEFEEIDKSVKTFMEKEKIRQEKEEKRREEEKAKKAQTSLLRKQKQLEKLKKELGQ